MDSPKDDNPLPQDTKILNHHANALSEHFDTVTILVTRQDGQITKYFEKGVGNVFARYGHAICHVEGLAEDIAKQQKGENESEEGSDE